MLSKKRQPDPPPSPPSSGASGRQPGRAGNDYPQDGPPFGSDSFPSPPVPRYKPTDGILDGRLGMGAPWLAVVAPYVLEGLPVGVYLTDAQGTLVHANRAALGVLGVKTIADIEARSLASFRAEAPGPALPYGVVEVAGLDGVSRLVDHQPVQLGTPTLSGELNCGMLRPVADAVERADLDSRRLMDLGALTRRVTHDLNNMLVAVLGYAHLLVEDAPEPTAEIHLILQAAQRARELTGQILGYVGRPEPGLADVDLSDLVEQTARLFEISVPKQVRVGYELARDLPLVRADPTRLRQVTMNLIINAAEAVGTEGGEIVIRTGCATGAPLPVPFASEHERLPSREYGFVEVRDDGQGMDDATLRRAFEPFFTSKPEGRGLGLATVAEIMAEHRGAVVVDTAPGRGTAFRVLFPMTSRGRQSPVGTAAPAEHVTGPAQRKETGATVLVVEEEDLVRGMAVKALTRAGFTVLEAREAQNAIDVLRERGSEIDLVLLDLHLEEQGGNAVVQAVRATRPQTDVLYCSAAIDEMPADPAMVGLSAVLPKPYTPTALVAMIDQLLGLDD